MTQHFQTTAEPNVALATDPVPARRRWRLGAIAGGALALGGVVFLLLLWTRPHSTGQLRSAGSPLDALDAALVPAEDRAHGLPAEVVAVLGEHRGRHSDEIHGLAFRDAQTLVSCGDREEVHLWDAATLHQRALIKKQTGPVKALAVDATGQVMATARPDGQVQLWRLNGEAPRMVPVFQGKPDRITSLALSHRGDLLACAEQEGMLQLWDLAGEKPRCLAGWMTTATPPIATWHPTRRALAWSDAKGSLTLQDLGGKLEFGNGGGRASAVSALAFSPDGQVLAAGTTVGEVWLWGLNTAAPRQAERLEKNGQRVRVLAFSPDGQALAAGDQQGCVRLWRKGQGKWQKPVQVSAGCQQPVTALAFSPDGKVLAGGIRIRVRLWDVDSDQPKDRFPPVGHQLAATSLAWRPDGRTLATGSEDQTVRLWDMGGPQPRLRNGKPLEGLSGKTALAFAPAEFGGAPLLAAIQPDSRIALYDLYEPGPSLRTAVGTPWLNRTSAFAFSPEGRTLAIGSDNALRLWDLRTMQPAYSFEGVVDGAVALAYSPDGRMLATVDGKKVMLLWDVTGSEPRPVALPGETSQITTVAFSPDGTLAGGDGNGRVWCWPRDGEKWQQPVQFEEHTGEITAVAFSPDGAQLAGCDQAGRVVVWGLPSRERAHLWDFPAPVLGAAFAPDGRHLALANGNSTAYILRLPRHEASGGDVP
jgi:WD40 repeat protein